MRKNLFTILVIAMVVFFIASLMFTYQVRFTETAVVTHFDQVKEIIEPGSAGLHFKWFWPIDRVYIFDTRLRSFETEFHQAATEDQKTVILTAYATWRITDGKKFLQTVGREDAASSKIKDLLDNQVQLVLRQHPLSALVNVDPKEMKLVDIEKSGEGKACHVLQGAVLRILDAGVQHLLVIGNPEGATRDQGGAADIGALFQDHRIAAHRLRGDGRREPGATTADHDDIVFFIPAIMGEGFGLGEGNRPERTRGGHSSGAAGFEESATGQPKPLVALFIVIYHDMVLSGHGSFRRWADRRPNWPLNEERRACRHPTHFADERKSRKRCLQLRILRRVKRLHNTRNC